MPTPLTLITGVHAETMNRTVLSLMLDLPDPVVTRHHLDLERDVLINTVSDITGVVERTESSLDGCCVGCAIREDVIDTVTRLRELHRWGSILTQLPVGTEATPVAGSIPVACVVAALEGSEAEQDLVGDDLFRERGIGHSSHDPRGIGEVLAEQVEFADLVVLTAPVSATGLGLVHALTSPEAAVVADLDELDGSRVAQDARSLRRTREWADPLRDGALPTLPEGPAWRLDLRSDRAFHPDRLRDGLASLGGGRHRSKGCFWLPTRPDAAIVWAGSGGQVGIGSTRTWGQRTPQTRLVLTGVGTPPAGIEVAFHQMLMAPGERLGAAPGHDGFEPWLGPISDVA